MTDKPKYVPTYDLSTLEKCVLCGSCLSICPIFRARPTESLTPRGKLYFLMMADQFEGDEELERAHADMIFQCTACGQCTDICKSDVNLQDIFFNLKNRYIKKGYKPQFDNLRKITCSTGNIFGLENSMRTDAWIDDAEDEVTEDIEDRIYEDGKTAEVCFFLGCLTSYKSTQLEGLISTLKILERFNVDYLILGEEEHCCGHPYTLIGLDAEAESMRRNNSKIFRKGKFKTIITNCPGCLAAISHTHDVNKDVRILHLSEFFNELISHDDITNPINEEIVFHYPCELYLANNVTEAPIKLMEKLGIKVKNLGISCCGGGGMLKVNDTGLSDEILKNKIEDQDIDPKKGLATCCPSCIDSFKQGNVKVIDLAKYIEEATRRDDE